MKAYVYTPFTYSAVCVCEFITHSLTSPTYFPQLLHSFSDGSSIAQHILTYVQNNLLDSALISESLRSFMKQPRFPHTGG